MHDNQRIMTLADKCKIATAVAMKKKMGIKKMDSSDFQRSFFDCM